MFAARAVGPKKSIISLAMSSTRVGSFLGSCERTKRRKSFETSTSFSDCLSSRSMRCLARRSRGVCGSAKSSAKSWRLRLSVLTWFLTSWMNPPANSATSVRCSGECMADLPENRRASRRRSPEQNLTAAGRRRGRDRRRVRRDTRLVRHALHAADDPRVHPRHRRRRRLGERSTPCGRASRGSGRRWR